MYRKIAFVIMKKMFFILVMTSFVISVTAQESKTTTATTQESKTTKATPISNGCGSESSKASQVGASIAKPVDAALTGTTSKQQTQSCDQHDKDYYNGVDKKTADDNFQKRSPIMGTAVKAAKETSQKSYEAAQQDKKTNEKLQSTWEKENQQCLDKENYRVEPKKEEAKKEDPKK